MASSTKVETRPEPCHVQAACPISNQKTAPRLHAFRLRTLPVLRQRDLWPLQTRGESASISNGDCRKGDEGTGHVGSGDDRVDSRQYQDTNRFTTRSGDRSRGRRGARSSDRDFHRYERPSDGDNREALERRNNYSRSPYGSQDCSRDGRDCAERDRGRSRDKQRGWSPRDSRDYRAGRDGRGERGDGGTVTAGGKEQRRARGSRPRASAGDGKSPQDRRGSSRRDDGMNGSGGRGEGWTGRGMTYVWDIRSQRKKEIEMLVEMMEEEKERDREDEERERRTRTGYKGRVSPARRRWDRVG